MQVLFVQPMHLAREVRPIHTPREFTPELDNIAIRAIACEFDLPSTEVIKEAHVRLDKNVEPPRAYDEIRVHKRDPKVLHDVCDLREANKSDKTTGI